ncbi:3-hydroxybutyryl-CoA dehydrogenase [Denitratisoma oestradiolicum]|uniref:3-hydroxybutyryl-CoA dehydrogenase n=1 Tax=Denitratisoma oestradiolicum TaxID=311182 RepID=A0A6S6XZC0_9PROT|nr:3-hydroxybutyryl-CoA dehydrogenase [Denitratisoma oestradiolicum]TWO78930.1 3-hydroxybutyryl-CoA dehydrogenase [Denitratisoma oestradiolicum]CAB1370313.1 3-hydroxybutyryl-CoA dehydrogenase [Denitratisoma oestradiolicum]
MAIKTVGVIGAGIMGSGITQVSAAAGLNVVMVDVNAAAIDRGLGTISASLDRLVKKEKLTSEQKIATLARIKGTTEQSDLKSVDVVIEAATENEALKIKILKEVSAVIGPETILATNTSSISITRLAAASGRPDRFVGMHFFNPVPVLSLVEVIRGLQTSDDTYNKVMGLARQLGKDPITAKNSPGFVVNRILVPMINEAVFVLQEGLATAQEIDEGMKLGANHSIGPLALADLIGLDTLLAVMETLYDGFHEAKYRPAPLLREMVDAGYLGRKNGRGFFTYG